MIDCKGVIFDCDGVLIDSMPFYNRLEGAYLESVGKKPRPDLNERLRPLEGDEIAEFFQAEYGVELSKEEILAGRDKMAEDYYDFGSVLKDGVVEVLEMFKARGVKMCVATATDRRLVEAALLRHGILGYFNRVYTCIEEKVSKSSPEIFLRAARFLGTDIKDTLVIEDAVHAVISAKSAGFKVIAVYDKFQEVNITEIKSNCDYYVESVGGILAR